MLSQWNFYCIHFQHPTYVHSALQVTSTANAAPPKKFACPPCSYYILLAIKNRDGGVDKKSMKSISNFVEHRSSHSKHEMGNNRPDIRLASRPKKRTHKSSGEPSGIQTYSLRVSILRTANKHCRYYGQF